MPLYSSYLSRTIHLSCGDGKQYSMQGEGTFYLSGGKHDELKSVTTRFSGTTYPRGAQPPPFRAPQRLYFYVPGSGYQPNFIGSFLLTEFYYHIHVRPQEADTLYSVTLIGVSEPYDQPFCFNIWGDPTYLPVDFAQAALFDAAFRSNPDFFKPYYDWCIESGWQPQADHLAKTYPHLLQ